VGIAATGFCYPGGILQAFIDKISKFFIDKISEFFIDKIRKLFIDKINKFFDCRQQSDRFSSDHRRPSSSTIGEYIAQVSQTAHVKSTESVSIYRSTSQPGKVRAVSESATRTKSTSRSERTPRSSMIQVLIGFGRLQPLKLPYKMTRSRIKYQEKKCFREA
jgi:hypothetical protein